MPSRRLFLIGLGVAGGAALGSLERSLGVIRSQSVLLRPPGALPELDFLASCVRCGQCVEVCPVQCLRLASARTRTAVGTPYVVPRQTACNLCAGHDTLRCIEACPTQALSEVASPREIRMGTAVVLEERCLAYNRVVCRSCWHACPFPNEAIGFDDRLRPVIDADRCVGCGLCTHACPTEPTSIPIQPRGQKALAEDPLRGPPTEPQPR